MDKILHHDKGHQNSHDHVRNEDDGINEGQKNIKGVQTESKLEKFEDFMSKDETKEADDNIWGGR